MGGIEGQDPAFDCCVLQKEEVESSGGGKGHQGDSEGGTALLAEDPERDATVYEAALDQLKSFQVEKCRAAALRPRVRDFVEGERSSAFFLGMEKKRQGKSVIKSLYDAGGTICTEADEILGIVKDFYKGLFSSGGCDENAVEACVKCLTTRVGDVDRKACDADITVNEIRKAISRQNKNKSPGADGLNAEFYQCFQDDLVPLLSRVFGSFFLGRLPTPSFCLGIVKLFKDKGDKADLDNYRPITLKH